MYNKTIWNTSNYTAVFPHKSCWCTLFHLLAIELSCCCIMTLLLHFLLKGWWFLLSGAPQKTWKLFHRLSYVLRRTKHGNTITDLTEGLYVSQKKYATCTPPCKSQDGACEPDLLHHFGEHHILSIACIWEPTDRTTVIEYIWSSSKKKYRRGEAQVSVIFFCSNIFSASENLRKRFLWYPR